MAPKAVQIPKLVVAHEAISSTTQQTGTKESPILLLSDDEGLGEENLHRPLVVNKVSQKRYLGVSPSDTYTFTGHGSAYDIMIAMGYKPDRGLGPNLRGNLRPLPIELRNLRAGVGYRATGVSRSSSLPKKAPVKIIRPPREPVASTSKTGESVAKGTSKTSSQLKEKVQKPAPPRSAPSTSLPNPPKPTLAQPHSPLQTVISPPPPPSFAPSDLYISLMSGLAMANMPQTMQAAAVADPMAAFQFAQMCFAPSSPFPLPPFSLVPPQTDLAPIPLHLPTPNLPPKPLTTPTRQNPKVPPPASLSALTERDPDPTPPSPSASTPDFSVMTEIDPLTLRNKRQARKNNIGWIPEPGFPDRGTFDLVPTAHYARWSSDDGATPPDPQRSLVMEDLPGNCRTMQFVRSWADQFPAIAVYLNGNAKALIEFPSREMAEVAYDSPRLRGGSFDKATHVRVFWYRPRPGDAPTSPIITTNGIPGFINESNDVNSSDTLASHEGPMTAVTRDPSLEVETIEIERGVGLKGKGKASPLPPTEHDLIGIDPSSWSSTAPSIAPRLGSPSATLFTECEQGRERKRSSPTNWAVNKSRGGTENSILFPHASPSPTVPPTTPAEAPSPPLCPPSMETVQREQTPSESPPSLTYPSSTPERTNDKSRAPSPSGESPRHDSQSPISTYNPPVAGDTILEQQLRMRLLAMKKTRIANKNCERSSSSSTPSTTVDLDASTLFNAASPPLPNRIAISQSLELLATSFITDAIQAAQGLSSEPERFDTAVKARLSKKRGSHDVFGSSADIALKRQRLAQQIEESKRIMERWKTAKTKEEKKRIYELWEESNRSVKLLSTPVAVPFQWPCYAESWLVVDSDDDEDMDVS